MARLPGSRGYAIAPRPPDQTWPHAFQVGPTCHTPRVARKRFPAIRGNKPPSKSIYTIAGAATTKNPMNLFGPSGIYTYEGRRMQSAGFQEPQKLREGQ